MAFGDCQVQGGASVSALRVRVPPEHPALPLAFCPLVVTQPAALAALEEGALLNEVLEPVSEAFNEFLDDQRRTPQ